MRIHTGVRFDDQGRPVGAVLSENVPDRAVAHNDLVRGSFAVPLPTRRETPEHAHRRVQLALYARAYRSRLQRAEAASRVALGQGSAES